MDIDERLFWLSEAELACVSAEVTLVWLNGRDHNRNGNGNVRYPLGADKVTSLPAASCLVSRPFSHLLPVSQSASQPARKSIFLLRGAT